jgi:serine/threonine protein kinase
MYPNRNQYKNAVLNEMFPFEENGGYKFLPVFEKGEPIIASGGNAIVFKVKNDEGIEFAVKLFSDEIKGRFKRLIAISEYLENTQLKFFTHFKFIEKLIYVEMPGVPDEKCFFPGVVMNWIIGETLDIKLKELAQKGKRRDFKILAENFKDISQSLLENGIAHGDLKLSNILVNDKLELFLIDYDGMFVPSLVGQPAMEKGTPSYQHPIRSENDFNNTIDHFSILNIYTSLLILSDNPALLEQYNDGDNIIFVKEDFESPSQSELFTLLKNLSIQAQLNYQLKSAATKSSIRIKNIEDLLLGNFPVPNIVITHSPEYPVDGEIVKLTWKSHNSECVKINGAIQKRSGVLDVIIGRESNLLIEYGTEVETIKVDYRIKPVSDDYEEVVSHNVMENESVFQSTHYIQLDRQLKEKDIKIIRLKSQCIKIKNRYLYLKKLNYIAFFLLSITSGLVAYFIFENYQKGFLKIVSRFYKYIF